MLATPEQLFTLMTTIQWGWMDERFCPYFKIGNRAFYEEHYRLLLPSQVFEHHIGNCNDQTVFENEMFTLHLPQYEHKMISILQYPKYRHTFLVFRKGHLWFWFEHSFSAHQGIWGPFVSLASIVESVYQYMESSHKSNHGYDYYVLDPEKFKNRLTAEQFVAACQ